MLTTAALILIVSSKVVLGQDDRVSVEGEIYPLDMAENSVDDRYDGCTQYMESMLRKYLIKEITANISVFGATWIRSLVKIPGPDELKIHHLIAINVYSRHKLHKDFNGDVRAGKQQYRNKTYRWYSLHFLLTEAIKTLKKTQQGCKLTYRGTRVIFNHNVLNKDIRFGSFASSSTDQEVAMRFGKESCFEIETCHCADVSKYSQFPDEKEVLIPPYETFLVTDIKREEEGAWCKTVFKLRSSGYRSDLNCAVV